MQKTRLRGKGLIILSIVLALCTVGTGLAVAFRPESEPPSAKTESVVLATPPATSAPPQAPLTDDQKLVGAMDSQSQFVWPTTGDLTSYMGPGHPTGIDIGMSYSEDSLVRAAAGGVVTFSGGDPCCDYGYHVEIDNGDGWSTLYGHFSVIGVKEGQEVDQGSLLGLGGQTGLATGKHLHFEIRKDEDTYVDPLRYLPPDQVRKRPTAPVSCPGAVVNIDPDSRAAFNFTSASLSTSHLVGATVTAKSPGQGEPPVSAEVLGPMNLVVSVGTPDNATGRVFDYNMAVAFISDAGSTASYDCTLRLKTVQSFPTMTRAIFPPVATPTRRPSTPTPKPKATTPASTSTPVPTKPSTKTQTPVPATPTSSPPRFMPGVPTSLPSSTPVGNKAPAVATPKR